MANFKCSSQNCSTANLFNFYKSIRWSFISVKCPLYKISSFTTSSFENRTQLWGLQVQCIQDYSNTESEFRSPFKMLDNLFYRLLQLVTCLHNATLKKFPRSDLSRMKSDQVGSSKIKKDQVRSRRIK